MPKEEKCRYQQTTSVLESFPPPSKTSAESYAAILRKIRNAQTNSMAATWDA